MAEYFCDENSISGETYWTCLETLAEIKLMELKGEVPDRLMRYSYDLYKEILDCYEYETRNPTIYGNVVRCEMEFAKSSGERNLTLKEMKITFNEHCAFHQPTYDESNQN